MSNFFAYLNRMKYINRWHLMHNTRVENIMEHSQQVAMFAHALAVIGNQKFGKDYDQNKIAVLALYHESSEVLTGDLPTPIKYFNPEISKAYKDLEAIATKKLVGMLPEEFRQTFGDIMKPVATDEEKQLVKSADKISAYTKCVEEMKNGNKEFAKAKKSIEAELKASSSQEVQYFAKHFLPAFNLSLDEME